MILRILTSIAVAFIVYLLVAFVLNTVIAGIVAYATALAVLAGLIHFFTYPHLTRR